jgi:hypothetical protein
VSAYITQNKHENTVLVGCDHTTSELLQKNIFAECLLQIQILPIQTAMKLVSILLCLPDAELMVNPLNSRSPTAVPNQ